MNTTPPLDAEFPHQRKCSRVHLPVAAEIQFPQCPQPHARLRDISVLGAYFYADCNPEQGSPISIRFALPVVGQEMKITCEGVVVRVEPGSGDETSGIAMQFTSYEMAQGELPC